MKNKKKMKVRLKKKGKYFNGNRKKMLFFTYFFRKNKLK